MDLEKIGLGLFTRLQGLSAAVSTDYFHMIFNLMMIKNGTSNKRSENGIQQNLTSSNKRSNATNSTIGSWGIPIGCRLADWKIYWSLLEVGR